MSVNTIYAPVEQAGNSVTLTHAFPFKILANTDIVARKKAADGTYSAPLVLGVDYTVAFDVNVEGGVVTWTVAPVTGGASNLQRISDKTQGTVYPREGNLPAKTSESVADKLTLLTQELIDRITARAPLYPAVPLNPAQLIIKPVTDRRALIASTNGDGTFNIVPSTYDPDAQEAAAAASAAAALASQVAAAVSAAAALVSQIAAAVSAAAALVSQNAAAASASAMVGTSGLKANRPVGGAVRLWYFATDEGQEYMWSPAAAQWFTQG